MNADMENFMRYKMVGGHLRLKEGIVPHKFACQKSEKASKSTERLAKRQRKELVDDMLQSEPATSQQPMADDQDVDMSIMVTAEPSSLDVGVQATAQFRSKATNTEKKKFKNCDSSTVATQTVSIVDSPIKIPALIKGDDCSDAKDDLSDTCSSVYSDDDASEYVPESESEYENTEVENEEMQIWSRRCTLFHMEKDPELFLGIPKKCYFLIAYLSNTTKCSTVDILITIRKIKLNDSFAVLSKCFGMSVSNVSRIFRKTVFLLASVLQSFIVWPTNDHIKAKLPIAFRSRYCNVQSIIDCFEIQIEKPTNPEHQALTWSSYYNCNTLKYLVSMTPDGLVNFVSRGYGGRISDLLITEESGFNDRLLPGMNVMSDRGFKHLAPCLEQKGCKLVRPPSVQEGEQCKPEEVLAAKRIASVRIHVERLIGRFRCFQMLLPHACVDNHHIPILNQIVLVAAGIINVQSTLIGH